MNWRIVLLNFVLAVVVATVLGSIIQTQFNLAAIAGLGVDIPLRMRFGTTLHDLWRFTPVFGAMVTVTLLAALPAAALLARALPEWRGALFFVAGAAGILTTFVIVNAALPMPTFIGATRGVLGTTMLMLSVAFGAWLFATIVWRRVR